jgi:hypothetical protein
MKTLFTGACLVLSLTGFAANSFVKELLPVEVLTNEPTNDDTKKADKKASSLNVLVLRQEQGLRLSIHCQNQATSTLKIFVKDDSDKILYQTEIAQSEYASKFDMNSLPNGSYTIELVNSKDTYTRKVTLSKKDGSRVLEVL